MATKTVQDLLNARGHPLAINYQKRLKAPLGDGPPALLQDILEGPSGPNCAVAGNC